MRIFFACLLSLALLLSSCNTPLPPATPTQASTAVPDLFDTPWDDRSIFKGGLVPSEQPVLEELPNASVYHLEFKIAEDLYHLTGSEDVRYTNSEEVALSEVRFRLFPNILGGEMTVSNLTVNENSVTPKRDLRESLLVVPLSPALEPNQSIVIHMDFAVTVPQEVELNYGMLAYFDNVLALAHAYPMIAVYDDEGWNAEIPPQSGDIVYADASFFLVKITAPKDVTVVASGHELNRTEASQTQMLQVASGPARDFYVAASPDYEVISREVGEVTVRSFAPRQLETGAAMALDVAGRAIEDFSARYAPYPYTEFDIVATPTLALGIEYPGIVAITSRIYDVNAVFQNTPVSVYMEATVAHEVGHQWFYNLVGDDQLDDPWLDESLTQFATLQYYQDEYGANGARGFQNSLEGRWENVNRAEIPIGMPVASYSDQEYGAIVYGRGPLFFVALQERMGTERFAAFIKEYTGTLSWGIATPEVLQALAEKHCSCELDDLFQEWVYP